MKADGVGLATRLVRQVLQALIAVLMRAFYGLRVINPPKEAGALILAPNHASFIDPIVVQALYQRHVTYLMDAAFYRDPIVNWFYRLWGVIPLDTEGVAASALKSALRCARKGGVVGIFPEGRVSLNGELQEGLAGVALLMQKSGVPVVPVAILGAHGVLPRHARFLRPGRILVAFGDPIPPMTAEKDRKKAAGQLRDEVMASIARLQAQYAPYR